MIYSYVVAMVNESLYQMIAMYICSIIIVCMVTSYNVSDVIYVCSMVNKLLYQMMQIV